MPKKYIKDYLKKERRKTQRLKIPFKLKIRLAKKNHWENAESKNISGGGVGIYFGRPLKPDDRVEVMIYMDKNPKPFNMLCRVDWCEERGKGRFRIGLKFLKIKNQPQFMDSLCEKLLEQKRFR